MGVTIVKPKTKTVDAETTSQVVVPEVVDEFAMLSAKLAKKLEKLDPLKKKVEKLEKGILGAVDEVFDPSVDLVLQGEENELLLGPRGKRTSITDKDKLVDLLGIDLFVKLAKVSVTDLKKYMTPEDVEQVTTAKYAIKRRVKIEKI